MEIFSVLSKTFDLAIFFIAYVDFDQTVSDKEQIKLSLIVPKPLDIRY